MFEVDGLKRQLEVVMAKEEELLPLAHICRGFDRAVMERREATKAHRGDGGAQLCGL